MNINRVEFIQNNLFFFFIMIIFCLIQLSLNFLSLFKISQPYIIAIILFFSIRKMKSLPSDIIIILCGFFYDLISGSLLGIHSLLFMIIKIFTLNFKYSFYIDKKYGEWFLFSFVYIVSIILTKLIFVIVNLKVPDIYAISYNIGTTLLIFPIILTFINLPKLFLKYVGR